MKKIFVDPVVAGISVICDEPTNHISIGDGRPNVIRNIVNPDILDFVPNVKISFTALDSINVSGKTDYLSKNNLVPLNTDRGFNAHVNCVLALNYTSQPITVKSFNNVGTRIDVIDTRELKIERQGYVDVLFIYAVRNPAFKYTTGDMDYLAQIEHLYNDGSKEEFHDKESKAIVDFLSKNLSALNNVAKSSTDAVQYKDKHFYINIAVCYRVKEKDLDDSDDLTVIIDNSGVMLSKKGLLEAPAHGVTYGGSLLYSALNGENPLDVEMVSEYGMLIYYNDTSNYLMSLYVNLVGRVIKVKNINSKQRKEGFFIEKAACLENYKKTSFSIFSADLADIKSGKIPYVFTAKSEAELSTDPNNDINVVIQKNKIKQVEVQSETIDREHHLKILEASLRESEAVLAAERSKFQLENDKTKLELTKQETYMQHELLASKHTYELAKHRRDTTTEWYKIAAGGVAGILSTLGIIATLSKARS